MAIATEMEHDAGEVLAFLVDEGAVAEDGDEVEGATLTDALDLDPRRVNDAVALLERGGLVQAYRVMGTAPYEFGGVAVTSLGRFQRQKLITGQEGNAQPATTERGRFPQPGVPVGSPYGFKDEDWEFVASAEHSRCMAAGFGRWEPTGSASVGVDRLGWRQYGATVGGIALAIRIYESRPRLSQ